jgi:NAD-dependent deacetylase
MESREISQAREILDRARRVVVLTGAGVSAESGVPTFRGAGGLWQEKRPEELATPQAFARDPVLVWRFYNWRRDILAGCRPNAAHEAIARLEAALGPGFTLITQNVDGLHGLAGSRRVLEVHGNIWRVRCLRCALRREARQRLGELPRCECGGLLRPDVVWFGEPLEDTLWAAALEAAEGCQLMLVVGTSATVQPVASLPLVARAAGAAVVEVNPEPGLAGVAEIALSGRAAEILPLLVAPA